MNNLLKQLLALFGIKPEGKVALANPNLPSPTQAPYEWGQGYMPTQEQLDQRYAELEPSATPVPQVTPPPDAGALPYYEMINSATQANQIPEHILYNLLRQESSFNPDVISGKNQSPAGAQGIAQFMPGTAQAMGIDPLKPEEAIPGAGQYLNQQYQKFQDWPSAVAAYNAGPGAVSRFGGVPPYPETQDYVRKILAGLGYGY